MKHRVDTLHVNTPEPSQIDPPLKEKETVEGVPDGEPPIQKSGNPDSPGGVFGGVYGPCLGGDRGERDALLPSPLGDASGPSAACVPRHDPLPCGTTGGGTRHLVIITIYGHVGEAGHDI